MEYVYYTGMLNVTAQRKQSAFLAIDRTDFLPIDFSRPRLTFSSNSGQSVPAKSSMEYVH